MTTTVRTDGTVTTSLPHDTECTRGNHGSPLLEITSGILAIARVGSTHLVTLLCKLHSRGVATAQVLGIGMGL